MTEQMRRELASVEEAIKTEELSDRAHMPHYTYLLKKRRFLRRTIKAWEKQFGNE